ncbi:hypothetical protein ACUODJ_50765, partial [Escherichia sp. HC-CC]
MYQVLSFGAACATVAKPGSTTAIHQKVNEIMKSIGFSRYAVADLYEDDTQIYHTFSLISFFKMSVMAR